MTKDDNRNDTVAQYIVTKMFTKIKTQKRKKKYENNNRQ
jgi:hypothetical protein